MGVSYRILGPVEALIDDRVVQLGGPRQRGVLVVLLTRANTLVPASRVIDDLWEDDPPASAANLVQGYVSHLRKALGKDAIETRGSGYCIHVAPGALDLYRFERLMEEGSRALGDGRNADADDLFERALAEWRGPALADLDGQPFLQPVASRLEELRLLATEHRLEALVAGGRHRDALPEIDALVHDHPLRERPRWLQMLSLYRSGRQAEALAAYREARTALVDELGIDPGPLLQELERQILRQDPQLNLPAADHVTHERTAVRAILVAPLAAGSLSRLLALAVPLARSAEREIVIVRTVADGRELTVASSDLNAIRDDLLGRAVSVRVACFTSVTPGNDIARLAAEHDVDLLIVDAPDGLLEDARLLALLGQAPCDVGVVVSRDQGAGDVLVPFTGADHDWCAVELGAWLAGALGVGLRLAGASSGEDRDASRLLASASLAVQRALGVAAQPVLVEPSPDALVTAGADAAVVIAGFTERWRRDGLGRVRSALATRLDVPLVLVRRGTRPGGLAPREAHTRFTWTIAG